MRWFPLVLAVGLMGCDELVEKGVGDSGDSGEPFGTETTSASTNTAPAAWVAFEDEVLRLVNVERARGGNCGGTPFGPSDPLQYDRELTTAARLHSKDMLDRVFFDHVNPSGEDPFVRITAAGYTGGYPQGENIAAGYPDPASVMAGWMTSPGHCSNILEPAYAYLGTGYHVADSDPQGVFHYWTQNFGGPK